MTEYAQLHDVDAALRVLMRGLAQLSYSDVYQAHKALYRMGRPAVEKVKRYIDEMDFSSPGGRIHAHFLNGLFSLLLDLDENEAVNTAQRIIRAGCAPAIALRLKTICGFSVSDFRRYEIRGLDVYESKRLPDFPGRRRVLEKWLSIVPPADLQDIHRFYIVPRREVEAAGTYMPILFNISVAWHSRRDPESRLAGPALLAIRHTLYHEIGHHVHRHTFGQDPDQEREANRYAAGLFRQAYPVLSRVAGRIARVVGQIR